MTTIQTRIETEYSRKYYFGFHEEFTSQDAAVRHAEWKQKKMKEYWGKKYVSSRIIRGSTYVEVEIKYLVNR